MDLQRTDLQATDGKPKFTHYIIYQHRIIPITAEVKNGVLVKPHTGIPIPEPSGLPIISTDTPHTLSEKLIAYAGNVNSYHQAELALRAKYKKLFSDIDRETQPDAHTKLKAKYEEEHAAIPNPGKKPLFIKAPQKAKMLCEILSDPLPVLTRDEMQLLCSEKGIAFLTQQQESQTLKDLMELRPRMMSGNEDAKRYIYNLLAYYVEKGDVPAFTEMLSSNKGAIVHSAITPYYLWLANNPEPFIDAIVTHAPKHFNVKNSYLLRQLWEKALDTDNIALLDRIDPQRTNFDNPYNILSPAMSQLDFALRNNDRALLDKPGFQENLLKIIQAPENETSLADSLTYKRNIALTDMIDPERTHLESYFSSDKRSWVRRCSRPEVSFQDGREAAEKVLEYALATNDTKLLARIDPDSALADGAAGTRIRAALAPKKSRYAEEAQEQEKYYKDTETPLVIEVPANIPASPHTQHPEFSKSVYEAVYKPIAIAYAMEGVDNPHEAACKLALLFDAPDKALDFLRQRATEKKESKQPVHDALLINVPADTHWHPKAWGKLIMTQGSEVLDYLALAPEIETAIAKHNAEARQQDGESAFQFSIEKLKLKQLSGFAVNVEYPDSERDPQWAQTCASMKPRVSSFGYQMGQTARKSIAKKDHIPDIGIIDGGTLGFPDYYMAKVPKNDTRLLVMGMLVDCCNHVDGETADMALAAVTSPDGGCYALFKKSGGTPDMQHDRIMGKVSVFRGKAQRSAGGKPYTDLVFNSWERIITLAHINRADGKNIGEVFLSHAADAAIESARQTQGMELIGDVNLGRNRDKFSSFKSAAEPVLPRSPATASEDAKLQFKITSNKAIQKSRAATPDGGWAQLTQASRHRGSLAASSVF